VEWLVRLAPRLLHKQLGLLVVVFTASDLTIATNRIVYQSIVLGVLLYYGAKTWTPIQELIGRLD